MILFVLVSPPLCPPSDLSTFGAETHRPAGLGTAGDGASICGVRTVLLQTHFSWGALGVPARSWGSPVLFVLGLCFLPSSSAVPEKISHK